jgi:putative transposase
VPFVQHYCHLVWGTKRREPLIDEAITEIFRQTVRTTCNAHRATMHALGIMPDHVHLAVSIPPSLAIAEFVRAVKSKSSLEINQAHQLEALSRFGWQAEYGLLSFGQRSLPSIVAYVNNQAKHHAAKTLWPTFEIMESVPPGPSVPATGH